MKTLSPRDAFVVKELRERIKFLSSVRVVKRFGIVDRVARNFTGAVTRDFVRRLNIQKHRGVREWNVGMVMYLPVI